MVLVHDDILVYGYDPATINAYTEPSVKVVKVVLAQMLWDFLLKG